MDKREYIEQMINELSEYWDDDINADGIAQAALLKFMQNYYLKLVKEFPNKKAYEVEFKTRIQMMAQWVIEKFSVPATMNPLPLCFRVLRDDAFAHR